MFNGRHSDYAWVEWGTKPFLGDLLHEFPELVIGNFLVNASLDSGPLRLAPEHISAGWRTNGEVAAGPRIDRIGDIPYYPSLLYSEWYIFDSDRIFDSHECFINYGGFSLELPEYKTLANRFWEQMARISPLTFIAEGDYLIAATRDIDLYQRLRLWGNEY